MPTNRSFLVVLLTAVLCAVPSVALAQSAGDEQYADPLQNAPTPQQEAPAPEPAPAPSPVAPAPTGSAPAAPVEPGTSASPSATASESGGAAAGDASTLPYTGVDSSLPLGAGAILLGLGLMLHILLIARQTRQ